jgi:cytochrome c-type biogenesis protein CcmH
MIWLAMAVLALVTIAPLGWAAWRGGRLRSRRDAAMALHRAQLTELDRDFSEGRILAEEHQAAKLEVQRRLLADGALPEAAAVKSGTWPVLVTAVLIPAVAVVLYVTSEGRPTFPPPGAPATQQEAQERQDDAMITELRNRLAIMDPTAERTLEGYTILGQAELKRGRLDQAAAAWQHVLAQHFDPTLAVETAEVMLETAGHMTPDARDLFKRALAAAPPDAPWRKGIELRMQQAGGS